MDLSNATKSAPVGNANAPPRSDVIAARDSVAVDLPPEKTVQSANAGDAILFEIRARTREENGEAAAERRLKSEQPRDAAPTELLERRLVIEPRTRSIVLQEKDPDTGETVSQLPDEALLKLRIYSRELTDRARQAAEVLHLVERRA